MGIALYAPPKLEPEPPKVAIEVQSRFDEYPDPVAFHYDERETPYYSDRYLSHATSWLDRVYDGSKAEIASDDEVREIRRNIEVIMGRHWTSDHPWRERATVNRVSKYLWELIANLTDLRLNLEVGTEDEDYQHLTDLLTGALQYCYRNQKGRRATTFTIMHATLGLGYTKVGPTDDLKDVTFMPCGSDTVTPILPNVFDFQLSGGVIHEMWRPLEWFYRKFPQRAHVVQADSTYSVEDAERPGNIPEYTWNAINPSLRRFLYGGRSEPTRSTGLYNTGRVPVSLYTEFWIRDPHINNSKETIKVGSGNFWYFVPPGYPVYPFGRLMCCANRSKRQVLWDGPNYHWHAMFPFAPLRLKPVPWLYSGISEYRDIRPINRSMNHSLSDALNVQHQAANPTLLVRKGSIAAESLKKYFPGMPGGKLTVIDQQRNFDQIISWQRADGASLQTFPAIWAILKSAFDEQTGIIDIGRLSSKKQVPAEGTIEAVREAQQGAFRIKGLYLEDYQNDMGRLAVSDIIQFWSTKKVFSVFGKKGIAWEYCDYDPKSLVPMKKSGHDDEGNPVYKSMYLPLTEQPIPPIHTPMRPTDYRPYGDWRDRQAWLSPMVRGHEFVSKFQGRVAEGSSLPEQRERDMELAIAMRKMHDISRKSFYKIARRSGYHLPPESEEENQLKKEVPPIMPKGRGAKGAV